MARRGRLHRPQRFVAIAFCLALATSSAQADFDGVVVGVADGDTLTVLVQGTERRVRLAGIDAPEHGQPFGRASRRSLESLAAGRRVEVRERGHDGYGRVLGEVRVDSVNVNAEQVRRGYAWVFRRYSQDGQLIALEEEARAANRGLWRDPAAVEPWLWRERNDVARHRSPRARTQ